MRSLVVRDQARAWKHVHKGPGEAQLAHHRLLFKLMGFHPLEDVVQRLHGSKNVWTLLECAGAS
ncbi:MAG TPA: hypothetical protein VKY31_04275 [Terriglobia bacterium]|nr:hypothetical protein [Terriglobia bacterium]